jgi:hypothetical protein
VNAIYEQLFEKGLRQIFFIPEKFSIDFLQQIIPPKGMTVIGITWSKGEIKDLSFIIDDEMELKTIEPADAALSFGCQPPEHFVGMLTFDVAGPQGSGINKRDTGTDAQTLGFKINR